VTTIGIVVHEDRDDAGAAADRLEAVAREQGLDVVRLSDDLPETVDVVLGVGGDGTVLRAARLARRADLPVAGVNVGRVGYLAEFEVDELPALVAAVAADTAHTLDRMTVRVDYPGGSATALNDIVVEKVVSGRTIEIVVTINGHRLATYRTDGLIVASPVGSTAYSLSAGGPIVDPRLHALILTPVAPHSLLSRSLVVSPDAVIEITIGSDRPAAIHVDGQKEAQVEPGERVAVGRGEDVVHFLTLKGHPFPTAVRHQFGLDHA
jgi:NAD+ kinase